jgi:hypothetical protein
MSFGVVSCWRGEVEIVCEICRSLLVAQPQFSHSLAFPIRSIEGWDHEEHFHVCSNELKRHS